MTSSDVLVVLQARMGSKRLPGKSLMSIAGKSLVAHCVTRLQQSVAPRVMVATTTLPEDRVIVEEAARLDALAFRGDADDVLDRMRAAAELTNPRFIVRATADNPAVDPDSVGRLLNVMRETSLDHVVEIGLPLGSTVEAMTMRALRLAAARATRADDREHVTTYIRSSKHGFRCGAVSAPTIVHRPELRFTVDTWGDLEYMRRVFAHANVRDKEVASLARLIAAADLVSRADGEVA
jgi:spore coat polysaccharide biosynthesis protein SpsF